ncbi:MAG: argininosuccinate lyase [Armatimonadota bacterium]|nr:argininosuccinate lyase [Armatimonadota bacterium]MDR5697188.1 argininosuccinate lyase [Armatimonadota bacterium]
MGSDPPPKMWGGRFAGRLDSAIDRFTRSLPFDRRLARWDLIGSLAHARMLAETGTIPRADAEAILRGLSEMLRDLESGVLAAEGPDEDVHSWIERVLHERIGPAAGRLHTARSRNDQTATALRLYVRDALERVIAQACELIDVWVRQAVAHTETWMPGYTHLQRAQPVSLAHHLLAHAWSLASDVGRLRAVHAAAGTSPLGAGALAGTPHPIEPHRTAQLLGLPAVFANSMHAVADRDYVAEAIFACALLMVHLSRWAEEVVLWSTPEFGFVALDDTVAKGSSLMPQKKNPEAAELIRGKAGRVIGDLASLLAMLKGLALAYNSDLQEDKELLFDALDTASGALAAATVTARGVVYRTDRMRDALRGGFLTATDLADYLVRKGVAFRTAHERVGALVREAESRGCELWELPLPVMQGIAAEIEADVHDVLSPEGSVRARLAHGGPAPQRVAEQVVQLRGELAAARAWLSACTPPPIYRLHEEGRLLGQT